MLVTRSTLERFSGALVEFWGGGQVNEYIETVLDEGESFTELQWFLLGEKEIHLHYSTLMRFEHFFQTRHWAYLHQFGVMASVDNNSHDPLCVPELGATQ